MISHEDIKRLSKEDSVRFALKAASLISHLSGDLRVLDAIEAAEDWLANPIEENKETAIATNAAASDAAKAAWATYAASAVDAAYATYAASAVDAAYAAYAAASAAASVAYAASAANFATKADPNTKPILVEYLRELLVNREIV